MLLTTSLFAQRAIKVDIGEPEFESVQSPQFNGGSNKKWKPKDWLEVEVELEIEKIDPKEATFADEIVVRWYVAAENPSGKGYILIEKEVTHINIPVGEPVLSSVYLSPSAVLRLSGGDRASEKVIKYVGGEVIFNGRTLGEFTSGGAKSKWWQSGELSRYDAIPLRSKDETPFHNMWWDRYAENKIDRR